MPGGAVVPIPDEESFTKAVEEAGDSHLIVMTFTAEWCYPANAVREEYEALAEDMLNVHFLTVDVDQNPMISDKFKVNAMPTYILLLDKELKGTIVGANLDKVRDAIEEALKPKEEDEE
mmetsp:Transcript_100430/g.178450  ORF Transcript_100430/g.178450 Transcript_100430/m.178450 type:complete len:119 (-) Transcript_100430:2-358(-)